MAVPFLALMNEVGDGGGLNRRQAGSSSCSHSSTGIPLWPLKQPASPDWHLIRRGLRPNGLIYVNCITNTKRLTLLPSGSVGVKFSKVPGFTEGRCSRPSTLDFMTKKELFPLLRRAVRSWRFNPSNPKRPRSNSSIYI